MHDGIEIGRLVTWPDIENAARRSYSDAPTATRLADELYEILRRFGGDYNLVALDLSSDNTLRTIRPDRTLGFELASLAALLADEDRMSRLVRRHDVRHAHGLLLLDLVSATVDKQVHAILADELESRNRRVEEGWPGGAGGIVERYPVVDLPRSDAVLDELSPGDSE